MKKTLFFLAALVTQGAMAADFSIADKKDDRAITAEKNVATLAYATLKKIENASNLPAALTHIFGCGLHTGNIKANNFLPGAEMIGHGKRRYIIPRTRQMAGGKEPGDFELLDPVEAVKQGVDSIKYAQVRDTATCGFAQGLVTKKAMKELMQDQRIFDLAEDDFNEVLLDRILKHAFASNVTKEIKSKREKMNRRACKLEFSGSGFICADVSFLVSNVPEFKVGQVDWLTPTSVGGVSYKMTFTQTESVESMLNRLKKNKATATLARQVEQQNEHLKDNDILSYKAKMTAKLSELF